MTADDIRAEAIARIATAVQRRRSATGGPVMISGADLAFGEVVDALGDLLPTSAGWRPPARVLTTVEELDALPDDTIIHTRYGTAAQRIDEAWEIPNEVGRYLGEAIDLPATVLWMPDRGLPE
jgi:hypothetical protein